MTYELVKVSRARQMGRSGEGRRLRQDAAVSVSELAEAIGVDPATLARWERGATAPRPNAAVRWVDLLVELHTELESADAH